MPKLKGTMTTRIETWGPANLGLIVIRLTAGGNIEKRAKRVLARRFKSKVLKHMVLKDNYDSKNRLVSRDHQLVLEGKDWSGCPAIRVIYFRALVYHKISP